MAHVRYWAGARAVANTREQVVDAPTLGLVLLEVRRAHGAGMARLLEVSVLLVDGIQVSADADPQVHSDTLIEILPPYAGGAR